MDETTNLKLPYLAPGQAQKHVTHNEALRRLDAVVHLSVLAKDVGAVPPSPSEGSRYHIANGAQGEWSGRDGQIAAFQDGAWGYFHPQAGWILHDQSAGALFVHDGANFVRLGSDLGDATAATFGINTTGDATNRLAVKSDALLLSHDDVTPGSGDMRVVVNKAASNQVASLLFQDNFAGRAEIGLIGDDNFHFKVSPDGSVFHKGIELDRNTGHATLWASNGGSVQVSTYPTGASPQLALTADQTTGARSRLVCFHDGLEAGSIYTEWKADGVPTLTFRNHAAGSFTAFVTRSQTGWNWTHLFLDGDTARVGVGTGVPAASLHVQGNMLIGNPASGAQAAGSLNAEAIYDDNALLSCYVFDQVRDGDIDFAKWDARVPNRARRPEPRVGADGQRDYSQEREGEDTRIRAHAPMRRFAARVGTKYNPLTLDGYALHWKEKGHLTSMPNEDNFNSQSGLSTGEWIQRLVETVEIQAVLIEQLNQRVKISTTSC